MRKAIWFSFAALMLAASIGLAETAPIDARLLVEQILGLEFTDAEIDSMLPDLAEQREAYEALRTVEIANAVPPALVFRPEPAINHRSAGASRGPVWTGLGAVRRPEDPVDLAFLTVGELGALLRSGQVTSMELARLSLARLERHGPRLECVITLTPEIALAQAARADAEIATGRWRGPLHGIPYGVKDLLDVAGTRTTWGAAPYRDRKSEGTATVVRKLEEAGAVLVAKLSLGSLAWGDVWFGGTTRNPWNLEEGSSGSSAGSAAAVAAGLVPFAIGTETWGSIVSPCTRVGVTGLRPSFGQVSRAGAMALSWSMDKIGPIARGVEDCAMVFDAMRGPDGIDPTAISTPFSYGSRLDVGALRVGFLEAAFEGDHPGYEEDLAVLATLRELGFTLEPVALPDLPVSSLAIILTAEAAAAFDDLTRSGRDDELVRQVRAAWPNVLRAARTIPAVEYIQANRVRTLIGREMSALFGEIDVLVTPSFRGGNLLLTNLTGHPCVVLPNGFVDEDSPKSITFVGRLNGEADLLALARAYQEATGHHRRHPPGF